MSRSGADPNVAWLLGQPGFPTVADDSKTALLWGAHQRTYGELREHAQRLAAGLRSLGLQTGDRIASVLLNRGEMFELYFAAAYAGLTFVPVSFRLAPAELEGVLTDSGARVVFTSTTLASSCRAALDAMAEPPSLVVLEEETAGVEYDALLREPLDRSHQTELQLILYTSGTTGRPKGVTFTHLGVLWNVLEETVYARMDDKTRTLINAPLSNTAGINEFSLPALFAGGTVAIMPSRNWSPERMNELIEKWQVNHTLLFPSMMGPMLRAHGRDPMPLSTLEHVLTGGENCPPDVVARFMRTWPHINLILGYGSTECGLVSLLEGEEITGHPGSVGRTVPGHRLEIRDADGSPLAPGAIGEAWVASPAATRGYWQAPEQTSDVVADGWVRTGDLARVDHEGHLYIEGRTKDLVISKGQNVYPAEVENALMALPDVTEAAVIGLPDEEYGEAVCAVVALAPSSQASPADLLGQLEGVLASYKRPRRIFVRDQLPRNSSTKVLKHELRAEYLALLEKEETRG